MGMGEEGGDGVTRLPLAYPETLGYPVAFRLPSVFGTPSCLTATRRFSLGKHRVRRGVPKPLRATAAPQDWAASLEDGGLRGAHH